MDHNPSGIPGGTQFLLNIRHRQHTSWQGSIQHLETGEEIHFRSMLELIHLLETAADNTDPEVDQSTRFRQWSAEKGVEEKEAPTWVTTSHTEKRG